MLRTKTWAAGTGNDKADLTSRHHEVRSARDL